MAGRGETNASGNITASAVQLRFTSTQITFFYCRPSARAVGEVLSTTCRGLPCVYQCVRAFLPIKFWRQIIGTGRVRGTVRDNTTADNAAGTRKNYMAAPAAARASHPGPPVSAATWMQIFKIPHSSRSRPRQLEETGYSKVNPYIVIPAPSRSASSLVESPPRISDEKDIIFEGDMPALRNDVSMQITVMLASAIHCYDDDTLRAICLNRCRNKNM